jgi:hypothetical protein
MDGLEPDLDALHDVPLRWAYCLPTLFMGHGVIKKGLT